MDIFKKELYYKKKFWFFKEIQGFLFADIIFKVLYLSINSLKQLQL